MILVLGGSRSGKSSFSEGLLKDRKDVAYVATARLEDEEMRLRVEAHRKRRPKNWVTLESPEGLDETIRAAANRSAILVDCITLYVTNLMLDDENVSDKQGYIAREIEKVCRACREAKADVVLVSNEVGCGIVPDNELARRFRDYQGLANQAIAREADEVHFLAAGLPIRLK